MTPADPSTAGPSVDPVPARRGPGRRTLAALGLAALLGASACGADGGGEQAAPSQTQTEATAEASASGTGEAPSPSADASPETPEASVEPSGPAGSAVPTTAPSSAWQGASSSASPEAPEGIDASVPGNFRGSESTTLAPGEAERVLPVMRAAVVPAAQMPGSVVTAERVQEMPDVPFGQPLPLEGVEPIGQCRDLVRRIDAATMPHTVLLHTGYDVDPGSTAVLGPEASVGSFLVYTPSVTDLVGPYGALPEACGTLTGDDGTRVRFSAVDGVPGAVLVRSTGPRGESVVTLGGASAGHRHLSATYVQVEPEAAAEMLRAQVEAFRAAG